MITAYFVVLCILLFIMHFLSIRIRNKKNISVKPLRHLIWSVSLVAISSMLAMLIPVENIAMFFHCVHYAGIVWMLILLLIFIFLNRAKKLYPIMVPHTFRRISSTSKAPKALNS